MIRIARHRLPDAVGGRMTALSDEILAVEPAQRVARAREMWKATTVRNTVRQPLREVLAEMSPGREHCMYCGDNHGTDVDHFEPVSRNPLRTFDWLNHLLACSTCNSHGKRDAFPLDDAGRPLLIDPTTEDPFEHLFLSLTVGIYSPLTPKDGATIEVCGLNRPLLARGRMQALRVVILCLERWRSAHTTGDRPSMDEAVLTVREQPFADVCQAMLRQAVAPGAANAFSLPAPLLPLLRSPELRAALLLA
ncbi:HNH endonuclease [Polymorphospora rubra]|uniref:HNH endonuclease n=2 Tax=Polymorphospora rubra TaxID=338584 RepID=UPI0033C0A982